MKFRKSLMYLQSYMRSLSEKRETGSFSLLAVFLVVQAGLSIARITFQIKGSA